MTDDKLNPRMARLLIGLGGAAAILLVKLFSIQILDDKYDIEWDGKLGTYEAKAY